MDRLVTIAALQLPAWTEGETARERKAFHVAQVERWLHAAGRARADVACLGETATTSGVDGPPTDTEIFEDAYDGLTARLVGAIAREYRMNVILPIAARYAGCLQNLGVVFNRSGEVVGHYAKVHPTRLEITRGIVEGDDFPVFDLDFGRIGIVICHDLSFPESTRVLGLKGAEIIFWPSWWSGWGEELCYAVIKSRAIDNGVYLVHVSFGQPPNRAWRPGMVLGRSGVIGPDGLVLSSAGRGVGMSLATIDLEQPRLAHSFTWGDDAEFRAEMLADRRPRAYRLIADESIVPLARREVTPPTIASTGAR
jgi:predicted amidohydrolase